MEPPSDSRVVDFVACVICGTFDALDDVAWSAHCRHPPSSRGLRTVARLSASPAPNTGTAATMKDPTPGDQQPSLEQQDRERREELQQQENDRRNREQHQADEQQRQQKRTS